MSKNTIEIPFAEIVERQMRLASIRADAEAKARSVSNDIYVRDIPRKEDWNFLMVTSSITFVAEYGSGTATIQPGSSTVTFSSDFVADSAMRGRKIKFDGSDYVYDVVDLSSSTGVIIGPPFSDTNSVSGGNYGIFQPVYPLNSDFERFPKNGGLYHFKGGKKQVIPEADYQVYLEDYDPSPSQTQASCRVTGMDTAGNQLVEVTPPPVAALAVQYDYLKQLRPMRETTAGVLDTIAAAGTTVTGSAGTTRFTEATTGDFFRVDNFGTGEDSEWFRIIAIAHDSSLTLATAFGLSAATSAAYTICSAPDMPVMMHPAVLYGGLAQLTATQDDPIALAYKQEYANILSDGKRVYKTRVYSKDISTIAEEWDYRR